LQLFLVRPRNLAGPWKAGNLEALVYFKFNRYQAVLRFFEVPLILYSKFYAHHHFAKRAISFCLQFQQEDARSAEKSNP